MLYPLKHKVCGRIEVGADPQGNRFIYPGLDRPNLMSPHIEVGPPLSKVYRPARVKMKLEGVSSALEREGMP